MKNHQRGHAESHSWGREHAAVRRQTACSVEESKMAPDPSTPAGSSTEANPLLRRFLGGMSIFTLLMTVPQVLTIWVGHCKFGHQGKLRLHGARLCREIGLSAFGRLDRDGECLVATHQRHSPDLHDGAKADRRLACSARRSTFELNRLRRLARPAVAGRLQQRVKPQPGIEHVTSALPLVGPWRDSAQARLQEERRLVQRRSRSRYRRHG